MNKRRANFVKIPRGEAEMCEGMLYLLGNVQYMDQPSGTKVKYYAYDYDTGLSYAILKKSRIAIHILLIVIICVLSYLIITLPETLHKVSYTKNAYVHDNVIGLNVVNDSENVHDIRVRLKLHSKPITEWVTLKPGESIGNVQMINDEISMSGSYICTLEYELLGTLIKNEDVYTVLVIKE